MNETGAHRNLLGGESSWGRVLGESSLLDLIASQVHGWTPMPADEAARLTDTPVPDGWHLLGVAADSATPPCVVGTSVGGHPGFGGLRALSVFRFTGTPDIESLSANADKGLLEWGADGIHVDSLVLPKLPGVFGIRADGHITVDNQSLWVRYRTYLRGSVEPGQGLVVEEIVAAAAGSRTRLGAQIGALSSAARDAFLAYIGATENDQAIAVADRAEQMRREAEAGPTLTGEQKRFLDTALTVWGGIASHHLPPIEALGYSNKVDFDAAIDHFRRQLSHDQPDLSTLDWSHIQFLAEISWASDMFGAGVEFELVSSFRDPEALVLLRSVQRALINTVDRSLVFPRVNTDDH